MALGSGPAGYPDGQRVESMDAGAALPLPVGIETGNFTSQLFNVSRFTRLAGPIYCTAPVGLQISHSLDGINTLAGPIVYCGIDPALGSAVLNLPLYAPYVAVTIAPATGATAWQLQSTAIYATNRDASPGWFAPRSYALLEQFVGTATGAFGYVSMDDYWAGPVTVAVSAYTVACVWVMQAEFSPGTWTTVAESNVGAGANVLQAVTLPPFPCRFGILSTGANTVFTVAVTASMTGSN